MKKYIATIKTTQEWSKEINIPNDVRDLNDYVDCNFQQTHYENFDNTWKNNLDFKEEYEVLSVEQKKI